MTASVRSTATATDGGSTSTGLTCNVPAGTQDGDLLLWFYAIDLGGVGQDVTFPAGWTWVAETSSTVDEGGVGFAYRVASSEPASYAASHALDWCSCVMIAVQGAAASSPYDTSNNAGSGASSIGTDSWTLPTVSLSTAEADELLIWCGGVDNVTSQTVSSYTEPSGFSTATVISTANWTSLAWASKTQASAGSTGNVIGTASGTGNAGGGAWLVAIKSAAAATPVPPIPIIQSVVMR